MMKDEKKRKHDDLPKSKEIKKSKDIEVRKT